MRPLALLSPVLAASVLAAQPAAAQEPTGGAKVYRDAVRSVTWIRSSLGTGSGSLVDRSARLVLTNYHVVEEDQEVTVFFPAFRDGSPIPERSFYEQRKDRYGIRGRVVARDRSADLALVQLREVPADAKGIPLAAGSPSPGDTVHSIGNAGSSGALWGYVRGTVRQVYRKKWQAQLGRRVLSFEGRVIESDSPTNPGDSGGPLLNDAGQLVGVTQGGAVKANSVSTFVDLSEVKKLLDRREVRDARDVRADRPADARAERRSTPVPVKDAAGVFGADAIKKTEEAVAELQKRGLDFLIETHKSPPDAIAEKVREARGEARQKLLAEWASDRLKAEKAAGVAILVVTDPGSMVVEVDDRSKAKFPDGYAAKVAAALLKGQREKKPDDGLAEAVKLVRDGYKGPPAPAAAKEPAKGPGRASPAPVMDKGKVFGPEAVKKAEEAVAALHARGLDVLVETYPAAPDEWREKAKQAKPDERRALVREWAEKRLRDEKAGVTVFVFLDPRFAGVEIVDAAKDKLPPGTAQKLADALTKGLREKKADEGLAEVLKQLADGYKGGTK